MARGPRQRSNRRLDHRLAVARFARSWIHSPRLAKRAWLPVPRRTAKLCRVWLPATTRRRTMARSTSTRRAFLESIGGNRIATTGVLASLETARGYAANDTLSVGCLGTGGRCQTLMKSLAKVKGVKIAAVCDIFDPHLEGAKKLADEQAFATKHYREVLDRK